MMNENNPPHPKPAARKNYNVNLPTPKELSEYIKLRRTKNWEQKEYYSLNDFISEMPTANFSNPFEFYGLMEQQANLLNQTFHYMLLDNRSHDLAMAFKAQKIMRETLAMMEPLPSQIDIDDDSPR